MSHRHHEAHRTPQRPVVIGDAARERARTAVFAEPLLPAPMLTENHFPARSSGPSIPSQRRAPMELGLGAENRTRRTGSSWVGAQSYANAGPDVFWVVTTS
jgi:hypothetical protein